MFKQILLLLAVSSLVAQAADTTPSAASIDELLAVMNAHQMVDAMIPQMDGMMQNTISAALKGHQLSPEEQKIIEKSRADAMAVMRETLAWSKLEPLYVRVYQKSFTQEEVVGLIELYKTPAGQALINKMPVVLQNTMAEMQSMMAPMMQRLQQSQQQLVADIKKKAKPKS